MKIKIVFLLSCFVSANIFAAEDAAQNRLTLEQAIIRVLENHPKLKVADYEAQAMAARMRRALLAPADRINVNLEDFGGTGKAGGINGIEATFSLSRTLELGDKAKIRGEVIESEANLLRTQQDIDRLDVLAEATRRYLHVAVVQERLRIAEAAIDLIRLTERTVEDRIRAGRSPETERQRIAIDRANFELDRDHRRHEMESSRLSLAILWNDRQPDFGEVEGDIFHLDALPEFEDLAVLLDRNPDLVRQLRAEDLAAARIRLAESKRKPDLDLTAGLRYLAQGDDMAFIVTASIPLGSAARARHDIREAEALSRIEPLNLELRRLDTYATLFEIYQELKHTRDAVETLRARIIPAAQQMLAAYETGFQAGRYSLLELIQAQQLLRNARSQSVETAANYHNYRIEIDRLTGAQLQQR